MKDLKVSPAKLFMQIGRLTVENEELRALLAARDEEIEKLNEKLKRKLKRVK
jgi:hypothetical protein